MSDTLWIPANGMLHAVPIQAAITELGHKGYLVIPPGDTSPVAELVRGACNWVSYDLSQREVVRYAKDRLWNAAKMAMRDPAVATWFERGQK